MVLGNLKTVQAMMMCIIDGTVVTQCKGEIDTVTRSVCVIATFTQVPTETGTWWSLNDPDGILKQRNSKSPFTYYMTMAPLLSETHYILQFKLHRLLLRSK